jgi:signal transduction histidine kinase/ActR/RegA family two-component response regulator
MAASPQSPASPDFRALFESAPGLYLVLTPDLKIIAVSDAYLQATMTERASILGRDLFDVFPDNPDDPAADGVRNLKASLNRVLQGRKQDPMPVQKYDIQRRQGEEVVFEERYWSPMNSPVLGPDGQVVYIIHRVEDVTEFIRIKQLGSEEKKQADELRVRIEGMEAEVYARRRQIEEGNRQRLEAIGRLAGGVAHDFNNILGIISACTELLRADLSVKAELKDIRAEYIINVQGAVERGAQLTRRLLSFSRQQIVQVRVFDLNARLDDLGNLLRPLMGDDVEIAIRRRTDSAAIEADPGQIDQMVMNLAVNARDAMPRGGRFILETSLVQVDENFAEQHLISKPGSYVVLAASDNGIGMDEATRCRIFEPFFTTKEFGKGTGLGLATVYGIVKQCGGHIWVYSEPGRGTTFKVCFPSALPELRDATSQVPEALPASAEGSTILLVEDDQIMRRLTQKMLEQQGYTVIDVPDGKAALQQAHSHPGIGLVLTDVMMPAMSGPDLAAQLRQSHPNLQVVFMSGYTGDLIGQEELMKSGFGFLEKPFTRAALLNAVSAACKTRTTS